MRGGPHAIARYFADNLPNVTHRFEPNYATFGFIDEMDQSIATINPPAR